MNRIQRALREMAIIGIVFGIVMLPLAHHRINAAVISESLFFGILLSPVIWGVYRLGRFVIARRQA